AQRAPQGAVVGGLDAEALAVRALPVDLDAAHRLDRTQVDLEPLRVGELAAPARAGLAVHREARGVRALGGRRRRRLPERGVRRAVVAGVAGVARVDRAAVGPRRAEHLELPQRVAVAGAALG